MINHIKTFNRITDRKLSENVSVINCENDDEFLTKIYEWGRKCSIPMSILHESEKASGTYIYSPSDSDMPSAVIINSAKIYRDKSPDASLDYATDIVIFHELGHCATKDYFKNICIASKKELFPALVLKESLACYYSYLCTGYLYEQEYIGSPEQSFVDDMNFFVSCMKEAASADPDNDGCPFLLSATDIGNIIGQILVFCKPIADTSPIGINGLFNKCADTAYAEKLYDLACVSFSIISKNMLNSHDMAVYCKKFAIISSNASSI